MAALDEATISVENGQLRLSMTTADGTPGNGLGDAPTPEGVEEAGSGAVEEIERPRSEE